MSKALCYLVFCLMMHACCSQKNNKMNKEHIDITDRFSVDLFRKIASYILEEGGRKTYCNKYNNSPHYKAETFDVYLDPINPFINWSVDKLSNDVSDYNSIVIQDFTSDIIYYHVILEDGSAVLLDCGDQKDCAGIKHVFVQKYLPQIEKVVGLNE